jgi:LPXTG-motif cell wall-anchored protein
MRRWQKNITGAILIGAGIGFLFRKRKDEEK